VAAKKRQLSHPDVERLLAPAAMTLDQYKRLMNFSPIPERIYELGTVAYDKTIEGISSDPYGGQFSSLLRVPKEPTLSPDTRYLGHLASIAVPKDTWAAVVGLRMAYVIGAEQQIDDGNGETVLYELEQSSPFWRFPDGNIVTYIQWVPPVEMGNGLLPSDPPGFTSNLYTRDTAWIYKTLPPAYTPLNGGLPPGEQLDGPGVLFDLRNPWNQHGIGTDSHVYHRGPGRFAIYVSVWQTNPARDRGQQATTLIPSRPEDIFVKNNPTARYTGVAGSINVRFGGRP
jgi:hypothetical protein